MERVRIPSQNHSNTLWGLDRQLESHQTGYQNYRLLSKISQILWPALNKVGSVKIYRKMQILKS